MFHLIASNLLIAKRIIEALYRTMKINKKTKMLSDMGNGSLKSLRRNEK